MFNRPLLTKLFICRRDKIPFSQPEQVGDRPLSERAADSTSLLNARRFRQQVAAFFLLLPALTQWAPALVIRHDVPTLSYENLGKAEEFNATTAIFRANDTDYGISGATAIDSRWGVHARHTLRSVDNWMDAGNAAILRGTKWTGANFQNLSAVNVLEVIHFDDDFTRFANAIDIALVRTDAASSSLRIAPLFNGSDELGRVGYGVSAANNRNDGNGNSRKPENEDTSNSNRPWEVRWGGTNIIDRIQGQGLASPANAIINTDFDHPNDPSESNFGDNTPLDLEYGTMNGDSGSPIYVEKDGLAGQVAGVLSGGTGNTYGTNTVYVRTSVYNTWIYDTITAIPDNRTLSIDVADQTVPVGSELAFRLTANSSESTLTPRWALLAGPEDATIDESTGQLSWTPQPADAGDIVTFTVQAIENGIFENSAEHSFDVRVPAMGTSFWSWSAAPPNWGQVTTGGGSPYALGSASFPFLQGDANTLIYQGISGTIPANSTVRITAKVADFNQTWSSGGELELGLLDAQPSAANAADPFLFSQVIQVPNYNGDGLADGLGNTDSPVLHTFTFRTTSAISDPYFTIRKNENGGRFSIDDIHIEYLVDDFDWDGLSDTEEATYGTDPQVADSDGDGYPDGYEVLILSTDPTSALDPGPENGLPYATSFESGFDGWQLSPDSETIWLWNTGPTDEGTTGPTQASRGDYYLYFEGHDGSATPDSTASLDRTFNFSASTSPELTFDYHMFGPYIQYLSVDVHDGSTWHTGVFLLEGEQHSASDDPWSSATVDLSAFGGLSEVTIRFQAKHGRWFSADVAIDNVVLIDTEKNTPGIGINFVTNSGPASGPILAAGTIAGAPAVMQKNWNNTEPLTGKSGSTGRIDSPVADILVDSEGQATSATVAFTMNNTWSVTNGSITSYETLMSGYLDTNGSTPEATVTLSDIPYSLYDVYVYFGSDRNNRTGTISDDSTTYSFRTATVDPELAGSYLQTTDTSLTYPSANYAVFSSKTNPELTLTYTRGSGNGGIHAVQIVSREPALSAYQQWAASAFTGAANGDDTTETGNPDGDDFTNLEEWVLATNPLVADTPFTAIGQDGDDFSIQFQRRNTSQLAVRSSWSETMEPGSWRYEGDGMTETLLDSDGGIDTIKASVPLTGGRKFLRLEFYVPGE